MATKPEIFNGRQGENVSCIGDRISCNFEPWDLRSALWTLRNFNDDAWLSYRKDQKGLMKGEEDLTVLEKTTQLTHKHLYYRLPSQSHWKKLPRWLNLLNGSWLKYKTVRCEKKFCLLFCYKVTPPLHHPKNNFMSKWHLIQPLQRETRHPNC